MNSRKGFGNPANLSQDLEGVRSYKFNHGSTSIAYTVLALLFTYQMFHYVEYSLFLIFNMAWNALVYLIPSRVISPLDPGGVKDAQGKNDYDRTRSELQGHAIKSEAIKRILGLDGGSIMTKVQQTRSFSGIANLLPGKHGSGQDSGPPGLGNWDNSCYQNSIIQGLASLPSLSIFLNDGIPSEEPQSTKAALIGLISKLNDPSNAGKMLWTPAGLKSMSSWQQQDAQEYFSKVLDEVDREISNIARDRPSHTGLGDVADLELNMHYQSKIIEPAIYKKNLTNSIDQASYEVSSILARNPLEGLLAQRVGCLQCGYVEGLSLIPFNCLTVPLGKQWIYDVRTCLDDYTTLEPISGVECAKCTILRSKDQLERLLLECRDTGGLVSSASLTDALQTSIKERLSAVTRALNDDDFSDGTLLTKCQIPSRNRVSTTKSRQAVIARAPKSLVIHVNRSVFDELTGLQRKNLADVHFPKRLDLAPWCLGNQVKSISENVRTEDWTIDPSKSMLSREMDNEIPPEKDDIQLNNKQIYDLRAVITHYGRHENGHYICYRKHRSLSKEPINSAGENSETWWRLSDENVSNVSEDIVLAQGGVFMLFYEKTEVSALNEDHNMRSSEREMGSIGVPIKLTQIDSGLGNGIVNEEATRNTSLSQITQTGPISVAINQTPQHNLEQETQPTQEQEAQVSSEQETQIRPEQGTQLNSEQVLEIKTMIGQDTVTSPVVKSLKTEVATIDTDTNNLMPRTPSQRPHSISLPLTPSFASKEDTVQSYPSKQHQLYPIDPFRSRPLVADNSPNTSVTTSTNTSLSYTPITDSSPPNSPILDLTDPPGESPKEDSKERQQVLTSPLMRTSGPRNGRGSVGRASKAMGNVSSMVTAN